MNYKVIDATHYKTKLFVLVDTETGKLWKWKVWTNKKDAESAALILKIKKERKRKLERKYRKGTISG